MARRKMNDRTQGLKNFVQHALDQIQAGEYVAAELTLVDLVNDIGGAYVCVNHKPKSLGPVGKYDPKRDGDYSGWAVRNNID